MNKTKDELFFNLAELGAKIVIGALALVCLGISLWVVTAHTLILVILMIAVPISYFIGSVIWNFIPNEADKNE